MPVSANCNVPSECREGRRLFDAYLIELTAWGELMRSSQPELDEATRCRQRLMRAREQYWGHVDAHGCRRRLPGSTGKPVKLSA